MRRLSILFAVLFAGFLCVGGARAAEVSQFTPEAFAAAQAAGKPILVAIQAPWCPTCAAQKPILSRLEADPAYANLQVMTVDFDTQKAAVRQMGATMQSTLVVFHGKKEMARSVGDTSASSIDSQVRRSLV